MSDGRLSKQSQKPLPLLLHRSSAIYFSTQNALLLSHVRKLFGVLQVIFQPHIPGQILKEEFVDQQIPRPLRSTRDQSFTCQPQRTFTSVV